jgi:RNase P/RNase MRP subunit POP5
VGVVVKDRVGRRRYIVFEVHGGEVEWSDLVDALREAKKRGLNLYLIAFDGRYGIVRCPHLQKEDAIDYLRSIRNLGGSSVEVSTHLTSGTIKAARRKAERKGIHLRRR